MRRVVITGLGAVSPHGLGAPALWAAQLAKKSAVTTLSPFDPTGFPAHIGGSIPAFKVTEYVPKSYRKATKIMARDIEIAVAAADFAVRDARLATRGVAESTPADGLKHFTAPDPARVGCNIGAGLINSDLTELTAALAQAQAEAGVFSHAKWGRSEDPAKNSGMDHLTPLWLLKYLPNMLACHVSIIHDARGPSNTITCGQASAGLALAEATRTIQRDHADVALVGGGESKIHPSWLARWTLLNRLNVGCNDRPAEAVRPLDAGAAGTAVAEGAAVLVIEELEHAKARSATIYAEIVGLGASSDGASGGVAGNPEALAVAMKKSLKDAGLRRERLDVLFPPSVGVIESDRVDVEGMRQAFGPHLARLLTVPTRGGVGDCAAGGQALDLATAALTLHHQIVPPAVNCTDPVGGLNVPQEAVRGRPVGHAMVVGSGIGGQHSAVVLKRYS